MSDGSVVVLDTNILVADYWMGGATFAVFWEGVHRAGWSVGVPELVITET